MQITKQTIAVGLAAAALAAGTGLAVSKANSDAALPSGGTAGQGGPGGMGGPGLRGPGGAQDLSALAKALGVSEAKLSAAMAQARPGPAVPDDMAAVLAKALGVSESKVKAALEAHRPDGRGGPPAGGAPPSGGGTAPHAPNGGTTSGSGDAVKS